MGKQVATATTSASASPARHLQVMMIGTVLALLAALSLSASAQPAPAASASERAPGMASPRGAEPGSGMHGMHGMHDRMGGMHHGMGGMHGGMGGMHGGMGGGAMMFRGSPERMGRMIDNMLDGLNASDAQRSQIKQIALAAATDLRAQSQSGQALRQRAMQAFTAPTVDAAAVEQVRQQMLQHHDQQSRRMTQAMLDVARVLTPEQRARLGERMRDRQARAEDRMKRMESTPPRR